MANIRSSQNGGVIIEKEGHSFSGSQTVPVWCNYPAGMFSQEACEVHERFHQEMTV